MRRAYRIKNIASWVSLFIGACIIAVFVLFALAPSAIAPYDPTYSFENFLPCSPQHPLGTNNLGYDVFSQIVYATRTTLLIGFFSAFISLCIGTVIGMIAGYLDGVFSEAINGVINFFVLIPMLPLAIVLGAYLGGGELNLILVIALLGWCGTARAVRAKVMQIKTSPFIESARGLGYGKLRILFKHILPNVLDVALARYITSVASCILIEATLSFLGVGSVQNITWGIMINYAYKYGGLTRGAYNWLLSPGICIMLLEAAFYFINHFAEFRSHAVKDSGASVLE